jgi:hypothetical protein
LGASKQNIATTLDQNVARQGPKGHPENLLQHLYVFAIKKVLVERHIIRNLSALASFGIYIQMYLTFLDKQIYNCVIKMFTLDKLGLDFTHLLADRIVGGFKFSADAI